MGNLIDMTGKKFGRLTVIEVTAERSSQGYVKWLCRCGCGNTCVIEGSNLRNGNSRSCGCSRKFNPKMIFNHKTYSDEEYNDGLYQDEILGKY